MGVLFLGHPNGERILHCKQCDAPIINSEWIASNDFQGEFGKAVLSKSAVNVELGERAQRDMRTGKHWVRPATCKQCAIGLGWYYEYAYADDQKYKEGQWLLERTRLHAKSGFSAELEQRCGRPSETDDAGESTSAASQ